MTESFEPGQVVLWHMAYRKDGRPGGWAWTWVPVGIEKVNQKTAVVRQIYLDEKFGPQRRVPLSRLRHQISFREAVETDPEMSQDDKDYWLERVPND